MNAAQQLSTDDLNTLQQSFEQQKKHFLQQPFLNYAQRIERLDKLYNAIVKYESEIVVAISQDFGNRSHTETRLFEIVSVLSAIKYCKKNLKKWMKPQKREVSLMFQPGACHVLYQPLGVIGIVVPWNYPLVLSLGPLIQVIAAGNQAMIKMSEYSPNFSVVLNKLISENFSSNEIKVFNGDAQFAQAFTELPFDHLVFTGATAIAKHVLHAAAENLTPVTLELGGKSPAIISSSADVEDAAARIAFGKSVNSGQTCIAPDYVIVHQNIKNEFVQHYLKALQQFYPEGLTDNPDATSIINERQYQRLHHYLDDAKNKQGKITNFNQSIDPKKLSHFVVEEVTDDMKIMQEEIFGPILPVKTYQSIDEVIHYINDKPRPLALYYFGYDADEQHKILHRTHSGGVSINETLLHAGQDDMPFGGVGHSGMGHYHGYEGFLRFSHAKSVFVKSKLSVMRKVYPPYNKPIHQLIQKLFLR